MNKLSTCFSAIVEWNRTKDRIILHLPNKSHEIKQSLSMDEAECLARTMLKQVMKARSAKL